MSFFRLNQSTKLPVFQNGAHIIFDTIEIIQYIERIAAVSSGGNDLTLSSPEVVEWMRKIQDWNPKFFTLSHVPDKYRLSVSKFTRRVVIARMAESPDWASAYHRKLRDEYETEEKLRNPEVIRRGEEHLIRLLDEVEAKLGESSFLVEEDFDGRCYASCCVGTIRALGFARGVHFLPAENRRVLEYGEEEA